MSIKISTLNLCLGLPNKKTLVEQIIKQENIDVCALQETEINENFDHTLLSFPGFAFESEINSIKSRVGIYINNNINYIRRYELEGLNSHIVIVDLAGIKELRIITVYRCFNPQNNMSAKEFFVYQLNVIKSALSSNCIVLGDFNLDLSKKGNTTYQFKSYFDEFDSIFLDSNLTQMVNFATWSRVINNVHRESIIDHIYCTNPVLVNTIYNIKPIFGDHLMIIFNYEGNKTSGPSQMRRCWIKYSKPALCNLLSNIDWNFVDDDVQGYWNSFENTLIDVVDHLIPLRPVSNNVQSYTSIPHRFIQQTNQRKRLLKSFKKYKNPVTKMKINELDKSIRTFFNQIKTKRVRKMIVPGSTNSLWNAVKAAKNVNVTSIPKFLYEDNIKINDKSVPDRFAAFFDDKIRKILSNVEINEGVYNGSSKMNANVGHFMDTDSVRECILSLKLKNSEGFDRIPQRVLVDGVDHLIKPIAVLMDKIYISKQIPHQWLVSKTIPVFKNKGNPKDIENYRPIANLCSTSKIFEKLILKQILKLQDQCGVDLTGVNQHGFKKGRGTSTLSIELQSLIARALDEDQIGIVASLDLSSAFDLVDIDLLMKRLKIMGLPMDIIELISVWLRDRSYFVNVDGENSKFYDLFLGTVQGSILGPVLYALFVSPLSDIEYLLTYADDNYIPRFHNDRQALITGMQSSMETITKWLNDSGLVVNKSKTEMCIFSKYGIEPITIRIQNTNIVTKSEMNVLGIYFDSRLKWCNQVSSAIRKANRALNAIKIIRRYFNTDELLKILTSNYYSILYYNSEVWMLKNLKLSLQNDLLTASSNAIKLALHYPKHLISYNNLHRIANRATPKMYGLYKLSLLLYKTYNHQIPNEEWVQLNINQYFTSRQTNFMSNINNLHSIGSNALCNRFNQLNNKIDLTTLNLSIEGFKILCKKLFLTHSETII